MTPGARAGWTRPATWCRWRSRTVPAGTGSRSAKACRFWTPRYAADGPAQGLALVDALAAAGALPGYHLLPATRADLLRRLGRRDEAAAAYREALMLATTDAERRYLSNRLTALR